jgi:hypothetical protein
MTTAIKKRFTTKKAPYGLTTKLSEWQIGRTTGMIHKQLLKRDIMRGVRFINEQAYSKITGCTKSSALFLLELRKHIDFGKVYRVDCKHSQKHHFTVKLFTTDGYVIMLKGLSFGYWGEGSRGSQAALEACGFKPNQIKRLFDHANQKFIRMYRRIV